MKLKKHSLYEILRFYNGKTRPHETGIYPLYGGNGIIDYVSEYNYEDNIIIGRVGANCGSIQKCESKCWVSDNAISAVVNSSFDKVFIYHLLKRLNLNTKHIGAAQPLLTQEIIGKIIVNIPDLETQRKIAAVLTALDDKIALNRRMNAKLEAMAKRLYDYWFVQFDFPDENGKPYKSSGGKMVWNEQLKRKIPEGWEVKRLGEVAHFVNNTTKSENAYNYISTDNMLPNRQGLSGEILKPASGNITCYKMNDILISNIRPYFKKIWFACYDGTSSTDILCIQSNQSELAGFIYRTLWQDDFFDYVMQGAKGSKMPRGDKQHVMQYPIAYNSSLFSKLIPEFNRILNPIQNNIYRTNQETARLTSLRDRLLPLLMNGQVEVG